MQTTKAELADVGQAEFISKQWFEKDSAAIASHVISGRETLSLLP